MQIKRQATRVILSLSLLGLITLIPSYSQALTLSDLIKHPPQVYLPSQLVPGQPAMFTVRAKAGASVKLLLSSEQTQTPEGSVIAYQPGKPTVIAEGTIPASGVLELKVNVPNTPAMLGEQQFVEAVVWSSPDQKDAEVAQIIGHAGVATTKNVIAIGAPPQKNGMMIIPTDDSGISNVMRSLNTVSSLGDDPRKKQLIDTGEINRDRPIDRNLNAVPPAQ